VTHSWLDAETGRGASAGLPAADVPQSQPD